ncbi:MAG: hypothetical protein U1E73_08830 [Planctomycetota bacterium]
MLATLSLAGWMILLVSCIGITWLTAWCFYRVLRLPPEDAAG